MRRTAIKLVLLLGLSITWVAGHAYVEDALYLRRDWLLLTVIQERARHKSQAAYVCLLGTGISVVALAGLWSRKRREAFQLAGEQGESRT